MQCPKCNNKLAWNDGAYCAACMSKGSREVDKTMKYEVKDGFVLVPQEDFDHMQNAAYTLSLLYEAGVVDWEGYFSAVEEKWEL